jgi:hypothetical protein
VDDVMGDILDDVMGPAVVNTDDEEDEEIYQMELQLEREMEQEEGEEEEQEEEEEKEALVVLRDQFIETHNDAMAKGVVRAIREGNTRIAKTIMEKTPEGVYDRAQMVKLSYDISAAQNERDLNDAEAEFIESVQSKSLVFKRNYSNREAVVVHDVAENIYHVAWHTAQMLKGGIRPKIGSQLKALWVFVLTRIRSLSGPMRIFLCFFNTSPR